MPPSRRQQAKELQDARTSHYEAHCSHFVERAIRNLEAPLSAASCTAVRRATIASASDPYGDGDQSPVPGPHLRGERAMRAADPLRAAWSSGLDVLEAVFREEQARFHLACFFGDLEAVTDAIRDTRQQVDAGNSDALVHLLERRVSLLRLTPLHYCCHGARTLETSGIPLTDGKGKFFQVVDALCRAGARVDARDLCGYTPLSTAAGFSGTETSLKLVPLLHNHGASPNVRTRFGESIITPTIMANNVASFRALLDIGADVLLADNSGLTPHAMASHSPTFMQVMTEVQREKILSKMVCEACGKTGATKYCSACRKVYYCSKKCQSKAWKGGHKQKCGKDESPSDFLDIVVDTMTSHDPIPGMHMPVVAFTNNITGATSRKRMKPKQYDVAFVVKVNKPITAQSQEGCMKINVKNSDFLLVKNEGEGLDAHARLKEVVATRGIDVGKVYLSAKWLRPPNAADSSSTPSSILRLDISKPLPPPKPLW